jgi:hypothetical protein
MNKELETSSEKQNTPENEFGSFCDVSKILHSDFTEKKEYERILEELNISEKFI